MEVITLKLKITDIKFIQQKIKYYANEILRHLSEHNIKFKMRLRLGEIKKLLRTITIN